MTKRTELLDSIDDVLRDLDAIVLDASNSTLAVRVQRLMESAAAAFEPDFSHEADHSCSEGCFSSDKENLFSFSPIFEETRANVDALRYMHQIGLGDSLVREYYNHDPTDSVSELLEELAWMAA